MSSRFVLILCFSTGNNTATIKFCDPEVLRREREQALLVEKSKQEEKERRKLEQQMAKEAKEAKKKAVKEKKVRLNRS
jgi:hypothetical protein